MSPRMKRITRMVMSQVRREVFSRMPRILTAAEAGGEQDGYSEGHERGGVLIYVSRRRSGTHCRGGALSVGNASTVHCPPFAGSDGRGRHHRRHLQGVASLTKNFPSNTLLGRSHPHRHPQQPSHDRRGDDRRADREAAAES